MILIASVMAVAVAAGLWFGARLAARGVTAENALQGRQPLAYAILGVLAAAGALLYFAPKLPFLPTVGLLWAEHGLWHVVRALVSFVFGLLVGLEWPGRRVPKRLSGMVVGCLVIGAGAGYLVMRSLPVTGQLMPPNVHDGVVFQTTAYTCAPASIATLLMVLGGRADATEAEMVRLAATTREGTSSIQELRAMRALGLAPRYARHLTPESLAVAGVGAVLHVDEPVGAATVRHAVALLAVDTARRAVTLGNPLHGRQVRRYDELKGYWLGEAVFATTLPLPGGSQ